jgi:aminopeptidase N
MQWENSEIILPYQSSSKRTFDLLHVKLNVKFDWKKQQIIGTADLDLSPLFYPQINLVLDAKTMEIKSVINRDNKKSLVFENDGKFLTIFLDKTYTRNDKLNITIDYVGKPEEATTTGSEAITSDKGLFFINPLGTDPDKPMQIWTQGETENNSRWFPTIDKPNERCSQEIYITVEDKFSTLSNGKLVSSIKNNDGTRTDYWKQEKPHAPYLFMMAIGEYAVINDQWNNLPLSYYVEKPYAPYAKQIFNHTPEMLDFFSKQFDYPYPWDKYAQVITRDYVSGAMENTSAVIFGEFVQKTDRELIDDDNDQIVAHEMAHHWFGDLVTIESWANLTLNEGFANYAEYLWMEHKYGKTKADEHRQNELNGYLTSAFTTGLHPLIHYRYANKEDMFDAHSYNKGGLVLHYLRNILGDHAFFASLSHYLKKHQYTDVEAHELRMAFEDVTGEDLNWFFDQWYFTKGHPDIDVSYTYNEVEKSLTIITNQKQLGHVFKIPYDVAIYSNEFNGKPMLHRIWTKNNIDTFKLEMISEKPFTIVFDGKNCVPGSVNENKTEAEWLATYKSSPFFADKYKACQMIMEDDKIKSEMIDLALNDKYYYFRDYALNMIALNGKVDKYQSKIMQMATDDAHSAVRESALKLFAQFESANKVNVLEKIIKTEKAYNVLGEAVAQLNEVNPQKSMELCNKLESENNPRLDAKISSVYAKSSELKYNDWFVKKVKSTNPYQLFDICNNYNLFLLNKKSAQSKDAINLYKDIALNQTNNKYKRYIATASLFSLKNLFQAYKNEYGVDNDALIQDISKEIKQIKLNEKDEELIERYSEF